MNKYLSFKTTEGSIFRAIIMMLVGVLLILFPGEVVKSIISILGVLFIILGVISIIAYYKPSSRSEKRESVFPYGNVLLLVLGIIFVSVPSVFVSFTMIVLGVLIFGGGLWQIISLINLRKAGALVPGVLYFFPVLISAAGVVILFNPFATTAALFVFFGIVCLAYGIIELVNVFAVKNNK